MIEKPILFSGPMVRAILDGRKTQTRRIVNPQPSIEMDAEPGGYSRVPMWNGRELSHVQCPLGQPGDKLWVREKWAAPHTCDHLPPRMIPHDANIHYAATEELGGLLWRPSIHMPRWASRIDLEITGDSVERLQDISAADAVAEGCSALPDNGIAQARFADLWQAINGPGSWYENPWVWVIEFRRIA